MIDLVYCGGGNARLAQIAIDAGFKFGAQLPCTIYYPIWFADQNWKKPDRQAYMSALSQYRPMMATVLDLEREAQLSEVLSWAEEVAQYVQIVQIIPKVSGIISKLPRRIGGADVRLGYSVPTRHGATFVPIWEFEGWSVHLLGGSPHAQMRLCYYLDVQSVDGNMANLMAVRFCKYWAPPNLWLPVGKKGEGHDVPYEAFRRSCVNIMKAFVVCNYPETSPIAKDIQMVQEGIHHG
jgi:hypothetical protein